MKFKSEVPAIEVALQKKSVAKYLKVTNRYFVVAGFHFVFTITVQEKIPEKQYFFFDNPVTYKVVCEVYNKEFEQITYHYDYTHDIEKVDCFIEAALSKGVYVEDTNKVVTHYRLAGKF